MWIVPIKGDSIVSKDGTDYIVDSYNNFKASGPAVLIEQEGKVTPIYFVDIQSVNGVNVEFNNQSKVLEALGKFKRKIHLPQKHDKIIVKGSEDYIKVANLKLHSKSLGLSRGLLVIGEDGEAYSLQLIQTIKRPVGDSFFDRKKFLKFYDDYIGHKD
jgi:hypothetical protein